MTLKFGTLHVFAATATLGLAACGGTIDAGDELAMETGSVSQAVSTDHVTLTTFQVEEMDGVEIPLAERVAISGSVGNLQRKTNQLKGVLNVSGLAPGAYTFWWHLTQTGGYDSVLQAGSDVVGSNGNSHISSTLGPGLAGFQGYVLRGQGLPAGAGETITTEIFVRYHGAASSDPAILEDQLTDPFGACTHPLNPDPRPATDYPCWNPQIANFGAP